jgi:hypothetical protein
VDSTIYSEIFVLIHILLRYVFRDYLVGDIARAAAEVSPGPQVPSLKLLLQMRSLRRQVVRRFAFSHCSNRLTVTLRRYRHEQVHVVLCDVALHDLHFVLPANIPDQNPALALLPHRSANGSRIRYARRIDILPFHKPNLRRAR